MIQVSAEGIHIPTNTSPMADISPVLRILLRYNHDHCEEDMKLLIQDYSNETVEAFLKLLHLGDVCLTGRQIEDLRGLISAFGIDLDDFTVSPTEVTSEYLARNSLSGESSTAESLQDQEGSSQINKVDRSVTMNGISFLNPIFFRPAKEKAKCPFDSCGHQFTARRLFFKHLTHSHMYDELMQAIPKQENGVTKCPFEDLSLIHI